MAGSRLWPVDLYDADSGVWLRPLHRKDKKAYTEVRRINHDWLASWEAGNPNPHMVTPQYGELVRILNRQARAGYMLPFAVVVDGEFAGQLTVSGIQWGSIMGAQLGYWVDRRMAGRGIIPTAVAMATDHCFFTLGLHRMEINIRPENAASLRVVEKLGFRDEGLRDRYMYIDGGWRDHRTFALVTEDVPYGLLDHWRRVRNRSDINEPGDVTREILGHGGTEFDTAGGADFGTDGPTRPE